MQQQHTSFMSDMELMVTAPAAAAAASRPGSMAFASSQPFRRKACGCTNCGLPLRRRASARYLSGLRGTRREARVCRQVWTTGTASSRLDCTMLSAETGWENLQRPARSCTQGVAALPVCVAEVGPGIAAWRAMHKAHLSPSITSVLPMVPESPSPRSTTTTCKRVASGTCAKAASWAQLLLAKCNNKLAVQLPPPVV